MSDCLSDAMVRALALAARFAMEGEEAEASAGLQSLAACLLAARVLIEMDKSDEEIAELFKGAVLAMRILAKAQRE